jgi:hypothetical protein
LGATSLWHTLILLIASQIFSRPLARCLEEILSSTSSSENPTSVATELCSIVRDHFSENFSVSGVAQSVVDKIIRMHRENFEQTEGAFANLVRSCYNISINPLL